MPRVTVTITNKQPQPYRFPLDRDDITLGRGRDNDISIQSESVSVHHAKMRRVPGGYQLRDLGSTNGLKMDGEKKIFVSLRTGMTVRIGEADFYFQLSEEEQVELEKEAPVDEEVEETKKVEAPKHKAKKKKSTKEQSAAELDDAERNAATAPRSVQKSSGTSGGVVIVFLILAAIAFFVGMSIRFQKDTGKVLHSSIFSKFKDSEKPPASPQPAE